MNRFCDSFWLFLFSRQVDTELTAKTFTGDSYCIFLDNFAFKSISIKHVTYFLQMQK